MKVKFHIKAQDATISLYNVPFDVNRFDDVASALATLAPTISEVNNIVKLNTRTDKRMTFDFVGSEEVLRKFFERYYAGLTWDQIKTRFKKGSVYREKSEGSLIKELTELLKSKKYRFDNIELDEEKKEVIITNLTGETDKLLMILYSNAKLFRRFKYEFKSLDLRNRKEIKIILDDL